MTDHVYDDTVRSYEFSNRLADGLIDAACDALTSKKDVPYQIEQATYHEDGALKTARIAFVAFGVPALGYRVFHVGKRDPAGMSSQPAAATGDTVENKVLSAHLRPRLRRDQEPARQTRRLGAVLRTGQHRGAAARPG